jgi:serine/threonine-protein kinase
VDSKGQEQPIKGTPAPYTWTRVSPDGRQAAVQIGEGESAEIGVVDLESGILTRLTNRQGLDGYPLWSQDGRRILFSSDREGGATGLFWMNPDGTGPVTRLAIFKDLLRVQPHGWSADGKQLVFFYIRGTGSGTGVDIGVLSMDGEPVLNPLWKTFGVRQTPAVSPDGAWIAYVSNESGRDEVYIERFPELGQKRPISNGGGLDPLWSHDGTKLYYHASPPTKMMVVTVTTKPAVTVGPAQVVFERPYYRPVPGTRSYSLSKDGTRLLMIKPMKASTTGDRIHVVLNWFDELRRLLPVDE